jgi:hypothetical protein
MRESQRDSVLQPSNGVARHELPWVIGRPAAPTATRLRPRLFHSSRPTFATTPLGLIRIYHRLPRVGSRTRQPWALRHNPFGIGGILAPRSLNHDQVSSDGTYGTCSASGEGELVSASWRRHDAGFVDGSWAQGAIKNRGDLFMNPGNIQHSTLNFQP